VSGVAIVTLNDQGITAGGKFTVATAGSARIATLLLLDNTFSGSLGSDQAAIRFVNQRAAAPALPSDQCGAKRVL
jgi:hypothetical protein